jgi:chromosomal replication initiator protein
MNGQQEKMNQPNTFNWHQLQNELSKKISSEKYKTWIEPLNFVEINSENLILSTDSSFYIDWIPDQFGHIIEETVKELYNLEINLKLIKNESVKNKNNLSADSSFMLAINNDEDLKSFLITNESAKENTFIESKTKKVDENLYALNVNELTIPVIKTIGNTINANHTFENFVVGASNQFAFAAAKAVAEKPASIYNPLFLYGNSGLGKTHLLHAIGNYVLKHNPNAKICYLSAEKFVNDLIEAIQHGKQIEFRNKYRSGYDLLLIDDIQFIANKQTSQEEFFHTFNALHASNKQIVVASDKYPKDIPGLEDRIRSRFEWGLVVDIQIPDLETRIAILKSKAENMDIYLPNDVANFLALNIKNNIRELEGILTRLGAKASLIGVEISLDLAKQEIKNIVRSPEEKLDSQAIIDSVCKFYSIKYSDLKSKNRSRNFSIPRQIAMYLLRKNCKKSYDEIGNLLGGKDHSTVMHGVKSIEQLINTNEELKNIVETIQSSI